MKKYEITAAYTCYIHCGEIEAESQEEAIEKAYEQRLIDHSIDLCWECSQKVDELQLEENSVNAIEIVD